MATQQGGVSSSNATAKQGGDVSIIRQGQTSGCYGNDPYVSSKQSKEGETAPDLKP